MKRAHFAALLRTATERGLLAPGAAYQPAPVRPWPVMLLTGVGAWISALLLVAAVGALSSELGRSPACYVVGVLALAAAVAILRAPRTSLFVEQLALPIMLLGMTLLVSGLFSGRDDTLPALLILVLCLALAAMVPQPWLRALLGATAAAYFSVACCEQRDLAGWHLYLWSVAHAAVALWLLSHGLRSAMLGDGARAKAAALVEAISAGWGVATVLGLAILSSFSLMGGQDIGPSQIAQALSAVLALAAAASAGVAWPGLRHGSWAVVGLVLAGLAWCLPALGALLCMLAFCACSGRPRTACCAALAMAWMVGAWYYQLDWLLADKALVLAGAGAALGALGWLGLRLPVATPDARPAPEIGLRWARAAIAVGAVLVLAVANGAIWQKEDLIAHGQPVFVALAPVDPRSLMQGDYMRLNFAGLDKVNQLSAAGDGAARPLAVFSRDARGVATLVRLHGAEALATGELLVELTQRHGRWVLVSDAWFFKEGERQRWAEAKYGELRVGADGRALLVGMRGAQLQQL